MSSCKERSGKNTKSWTPIVHLNVGFVVGVLFVLLTFLVFSQKAAISGLNVATTVAQPSIKGPGETFVTSGVQIQGSGGSEKGTVVYNTKGGYSETCEVDGDVRINCSALSVFLVPTASSERHEWSILPYSRKTMPGIKNVTVAQLQGVLVQVVPYGRMDVIATLEFGLPAKDMGLRYIDYEVRAEESTLLEMLGPEHPAIKDPDSVHRSGWDKMTEFYLDKQSVRINITRFAPTLAQAFDCLRQQ